MLSSSLIFSFVAFAAIGIVSTTAIKRERIYPEVIPGPGLPSLASLNLTSADLYTMRLPPLVGRGVDSTLFTMECDETPEVPVEDAIACFNFLVSIGGNACVVTGDNVDFCQSGDAEVSGSNIFGLPSTSSPCEDVALAVQAIFTDCNVGGFVSGADAANGNGNLIVGVEQIGT